MLQVLNAPAVARGIVIPGNELPGQWLEAISTHVEVDNLIITGNNITTLETGIWFYVGFPARSSRVIIFVPGFGA